MSVTSENLNKVTNDLTYILECDVENTSNRLRLQNDILILRDAMNAFEFLEANIMDYERIINENTHERIELKRTIEEQNEKIKALTDKIGKLKGLLNPCHGSMIFGEEELTDAD